MFPKDVPGNATANLRYKSMLDFYIGKGDFKGAAGVLDKANAEAGDIAKQTNPQVQNQRVQTAVAEAKAKSPIIIQQIAAEDQARQNACTLNTPPGDTAQHGDGYLQTLPPALQAQVKAISEGRATMPPMGTRGAGAVVRNAAFQYDPSYSDQRAQIRKAFTTGADGKNIGALNTASVHLDQLSDAADALKNGSFQPGNKAYNYFATMFGGAPPTNFNSLKAAVSGELASALKGNATDQEIHTIAGNISAAHSPDQLKGAIDTNLHILGAKLGTYQQRYQQQIPGDTNWSPVLPQAKQVMQKHGIDVSNPQTAGTGNPGGKQAVGGYQIGHMYGKLEYLGGDPSSQGSWKQH